MIRVCAALTVVTLVACNPCADLVVLEVANIAPRIASSGERVAMWWTREHRVNGGNGHVDESGLYATTIDRDGVVAPPVSLGVSEHMLGRPVSGTRSVLWGPRVEGCGAVGAQTTAYLWPDGGALISFPVTTDTFVSFTTSFDGAMYHAFWVTNDRRIQHRSIAEDGTLGVVHTLEQPQGFTVCIDSAGHGAGVTVLQTRVDARPWLSVIDTVAGQSRRLAETPADLAANELLWFRTELHARAFRNFNSVVVSLDPVNETFRERPIANEVLNAQLHAGTASLYAVNGTIPTALVVLDGEFQELARIADGNALTMAVIDDAAVVTAVSGGDSSPFVLQLAKLDAAGNEVWRADVATSSTPKSVEQECSGSL